MLSLTAAQEIKLTELLDRYELQRPYDWYCKTNQSNQLPYHNRYHTECMLINCEAGALAGQLSKEETQALLLAALFHDGNHSGGDLPDAENIEAALALFEWATEWFAWPASLIYRVRSLIRVTEYPYVRSPQDETEGIIRDADLAQYMEPHWFEHLYIGLREELGRRNGPLSLQDFCDLQPPFLEKIHFYSVWGRAREPEFRALTSARYAVMQAVCELLRKSDTDPAQLLAYVMGDCCGTEARICG